MGMSVGIWRFPEDVIDNRALIYALIKTLIENNTITNEDINRALAQVREEMMQRDPSIRFGPPPAPPTT